MEETGYSLKHLLKQLMGKYSVQEVHTTVEEICREDYEFLKKLFSVKLQIKSKVEVATVAQTPSQTQIQAQTHTAKALTVAPTQTTVQEEAQEEVPQKLRGDMKVKIVKQASQPQTDTVPLVTVPTVPTVPVVAVTLVHSESGLSDPKDLKKWQKEQEEKKKRELDAQGVNPASLLTKENLQRWIIDEKKTYAAVAREYVGLPDSMIASSAKSFGIQSDASKKRLLKNTIAAVKGKK